MSFREDYFKNVVDIGIDGAQDASLTFPPIELTRPSGGCTCICYVKKLYVVLILALELNFFMIILTTSSKCVESPYENGSYSSINSL
jgi:hypothetical protein